MAKWTHPCIKHCVQDLCVYLEWDGAKGHKRELSLCRDLDQIHHQCCPSIYISYILTPCRTQELSLHSDPAHLTHMHRLLIHTHLVQTYVQMEVLYIVNTIYLARVEFDASSAKESAGI